jgi:hypothetical protein
MDCEIKTTREMSLSSPTRIKSKDIWIRIKTQWVKTCSFYSSSTRTYVQNMNPWCRLTSLSERLRIKGTQILQRIVLQDKSRIKLMSCWEKWRKKKKRRFKYKNETQWRDWTFRTRFESKLIYWGRIIGVTSLLHWSIERIRLNRSNWLL